MANQEIGVPGLRIIAGPWGGRRMAASRLGNPGTPIS
jgi:hypothetical protein